MFSTSLTHKRSALIIDLTMTACLFLAFLVYLPYRFSDSSLIVSNGVMIGDHSSILILWFSVPSSVSVNSMLSYLIPVLGPISIAIVLLALVGTVHRLSDNKRIFGRYGLVLLLAGSGSLVLSGLLWALHSPNSIGPSDIYAIMSQYAGIALFALGVALTIRRMSMVKPADKMIGSVLSGIGALFLSVFAAAVIIDEFTPIAVTGAWEILDGLAAIGLPLVLIGVLWMENSILGTFKKKAILIRTMMAGSLSCLLIGAAYLFLFNGPYIGFRVGGYIEWGTTADLLTYLFTLGLLMILAATALVGLKISRTRTRYAP
jgi:hypothetical protein